MSAWTEQKVGGSSPPNCTRAAVPSVRIRRLNAIDVTTKTRRRDPLQSPYRDFVAGEAVSPRSFELADAGDWFDGHRLSMRSQEAVVLGKP
jgi:hypothetical protein